MPCLLLRSQGLVKTCKFKNQQYIGDPINAVRIFNQKEVDELVIFDIDATTQNKSINYTMIEKITTECFMPLCYGGGVRTLEDFKKLFYIGVEKVSVSSLLFERPDIVKSAIEIYGAQSIVTTLDVRRTHFRKKYFIYTHSGKKKTGYNLTDAVNIACEVGVGEIILNSIDRDGTWQGFDLELVKSVTNLVNVPVVALGGAGQLNHIAEVVKYAHASAVGIGSMAVFQAKDMGVLIRFPKTAELEALLA